MQTTNSSTSRSEDASVPTTLFITWTTYGTWLPGDPRGWRKWKQGEQLPQPQLERWCRQRMKGDPLFLGEQQRTAVEEVLHKHAKIRGWELHAVSARTNHVHLAVTATAPPKRVRDQFKANATRVLRNPPHGVTSEKIWTKGGDIEFLADERDLEQVVMYINVAQDRIDRDR